MDIKAMLLKGLSTNKAICGCYRLYFGKSCFVIKFELQGKYLKVLQIKRTSRKKQSLTRRTTRRHRLINIIRHFLQSHSRASSASQSLPGNDDNGGIKYDDVQKVPNKTILKTTEQQTIGIANVSVMEMFTVSKLPDCFLRSIGIQAEYDTITTGVQCKFRTISNCSQTDEILLRTSYTQTFDDMINDSNICKNVNRRNRVENAKDKIGKLTLFRNKTISVGGIKNSTISGATKSAHQTPGIRGYDISKSIISTIARQTFGSQTEEISLRSSYTQTCDIINNSNINENRDGNDKDLKQNAIIYILNEIGELVLYQSNILKKNAKMLDQITKMSMLPLKNKYSKYNRSRRKRPQNPLLHMTKSKDFKSFQTLRADINTADAKIKRSKLTQTDEFETFSQFPQTKGPTMKARKWSFFKQK